MYGVSEGPLKGWQSPSVVASCVAGVTLLTALVIVELRTPHPMVDLRLLAGRLFRSSTGVIFLVSAAFLGTLYLIPLYFQDARGLSALQSGLSTFPEAFGVMIGAQFASRLIYPRLGPRRHITGGLLGLAVTMLLLTQISAHDEPLVDAGADVPARNDRGADLRSRSGCLLCHDLAV